MYIYRIIFPDGRSYIGSTKDFKKRKISHLSKARRGQGNKIYQAIRDCGEELLRWEVLMDNVSEKEVEMWEGVFVSFYDSYKDGYNSTKAGQGSSPKRVINLAKEIYYSSIREAARSEGESPKSVQTSIKKRSVTARHNLYLLEEEYKSLDTETMVRLEETIKYKRKNNLKALWPNHKRDIAGIVKNRIRALQ